MTTGGAHSGLEHLLYEVKKIVVGQDHFLELTEHSARMRTHGARQLHRQRGRARHDLRVTDSARGGANDGDRIDAGVRVEAPILCRQERVLRDRPELGQARKTRAGSVARAYLAQQPILGVDDLQRRLGVRVFERVG
jgi:hypothetical protein